jgi:hypothetical protein
VSIDIKLHDVCARKPKYFNPTLTMKIQTLLKLALLFGILSAATSRGQSINLNGYLTNEDSYSDKVTVSFLMVTNPKHTEPTSALMTLPGSVFLLRSNY